jgi:outer membrane protein TolC
VRRALSRLQQALELVSASQQVVVEAEESLRLARAREEVGAAIQLDVLQGQLSLTEAETNQIEASYEYYVALAELGRATGVINPLLVADFKATSNF